jgi:NAD+ synthase (glutamine-hydrolysing)
VLVLDLAGTRVAVNICEDIWFPCGPTEKAAWSGGAGMVVNISMSPYHFGKGEDRERMLRGRALDSEAAILYLNGVGGQDELVFDGHSLVYSAEGELLARGPQFQESLLLVDIDTCTRGVQVDPATQGVRVLELDPALTTVVGEVGEELLDLPLAPGPPARFESLPCVPGRLVRPLDPRAEVYGALTLGVRDYLRKNGFRHAVLGLSGGIDSALTACVAADALGRESVTAVSMPSRFSSAETRADARRIAELLAVEFLEISIEEVFSAYLETLGPAFRGRPPDEAEENLQARIRGNYLMALSNKFGWLVLTTGNKSELAVGYSTLYGDMAGGFAVIKDVPKTLVYELSRYRNSLDPDEGPIPESVLRRAPSAELRPNQTDQDSLPPYDLLDEIVEAYVVRDESVEEIAGRGLPADVVQRVAWMIDSNEYKRRQAPPGPRVTSKAFGKDRRLPITNAYRG